GAPMINCCSASEGYFQIGNWLSLRSNHTYARPFAVARSVPPAPTETRTRSVQSGGASSGKTGLENDVVRGSPRSTPKCRSIAPHATKDIVGRSVACGLFGGRPLPSPSKKIANGAFDSSAVPPQPC